MDEGLIRKCIDCEFLSAVTKKCGTYRKKNGGYRCTCRPSRSINSSGHNIITYISIPSNHKKTYCMLDPPLER